MQRTELWIVILFLIISFCLFACESSDSDDDDATSTDDDDDNNTAIDDDDDSSTDDDDDTTFVDVTFLPITAGTFMMGSPVEQPGHLDTEPYHEVTLTRDFEIMEFELTQGQFEALMGYNPSQITGTNKPAINVTWWEAAEFANALSLQNGLTPCFEIENSEDAVSVSLIDTDSIYECEGYRLPTEAEWEYAAKAGADDTGFYNGQEVSSWDCGVPDANLDPIAWSCTNSLEATHSAGQLLPNPWNLYDMLGNASEWVWDTWIENPTQSLDPTGGENSEAGQRTLKGGSWYDTPHICRTATRGKMSSAENLSIVGFRLARTLPE